MTVPSIPALSDMINEFDRIMEREGVPEDTRKRVINTIIFGTPEAVFDLQASIKRGLEDSAAGRVYEHPEFLCGDYPAPCNCDDPETHGGH